MKPCTFIKGVLFTFKFCLYLYLSHNIFLQSQTCNHNGWFCLTNNICLRFDMGLSCKDLCLKNESKIKPNLLQEFKSFITFDTRHKAAFGSLLARSSSPLSNLIKLPFVHNTNSFVMSVDFLKICGLSHFPDFSDRKMETCIFNSII